MPKVNKTMQVWQSGGDYNTGDPPLLQLPKDTIGNVWSDLSVAATLCKAGYQLMISPSSAPANTSVPGSGWYLPPFGDCKWPGAWARNVEAELSSFGCDVEVRDHTFR